MFVDVAQVKVQAGDGGDGALSFRHEKFIDRGGPDGGDGGNGGDIIFVASTNQNTLSSFRYQKELVAESGLPGAKRRQHGRSGQDLIIEVPAGTSITSDSKVLADLTKDNQQVTIAQGGKGGYGNAHFVSSTRQAPRIAEKGEKGEALTLTLELKMIADVGLVGLPNAGKSTLLSVISHAKPEIADYPFTTLTPNLGVVDIDKKTSLLFADIPGLIEGASQGKGLGDEFLRHIERNVMLLHLIDSYNDDVKAAYQTIQNELKAYKIDLSKRPQIVALTKIEGLDDEIVADLKAKLQSVLPKTAQLFAVSAQSKQGIPELLFAINKMVNQQRTKLAQTEKTDKTLPILTISNNDTWQVSKTAEGFLVTGPKIERFAARTDFSNFHAVQRLRDIMRKMGIMHELECQGVETGSKINVSNYGKLNY